MGRVKPELRRFANHLPAPALSLIRHVTLVPVRSYFRYAPTSAAKAWLWKNLLSHLWWLETDVVARTTSGARLRVDARDTVGRYIYYFGVWEPNLTAWLSRTLRRGDVFVDIGANVGYFSVLAAGLVESTGGVVAIEALPQIHRVLDTNLRGNDAANARTVCVAAWDAEGSIDMFSRSERTSGTTTAYSSWADRWELTPVGKVQAMPLNSILRPEEVARARVIKIDAEGAEWRIVKGLEGFLPHTRNDLEIVVEMAPGLLREDDATPEDIAQLLSRYEFRPFRIENSYEPEAYARPDAVMAPTTIEQFPREMEQFDIIFSRSRENTL